jgi:lipoyl(octanoyl) transferase
VSVIRPGLITYEEGLGLQSRLATSRQADEIPDTLLILEHYPVYTKGRRSEPGHLPMGEDWYRMQGIEVCETDRGGQVTYHGPGQLVAYPIVDLSPMGGDVQEFVRGLERVMIGALADYGIEAQVIAGLTGVWTAGSPPIAAGEIGPQRTAVGEPSLPGEEARKIGSIGIHVNKGVTTHGLAINVNNDLQPFEWIVPCAIDNVRMTSVTRELGAEQDFEAFGGVVVEQFAAAFDRTPSDTTIDALLGEGAPVP